MLTHKTALADSQYDSTIDSYVGPWCRGLGQFFIMVTMVMSFGAYDIKPVFHTLILGAAFGCILLAPRQVVLKMRISLVSVMMLAVLAFSVLWTFDSANTAFQVRLEVPRAFFLMLVVAVLPLKDTIDGLKKSMWLILFITIFGLVTVPATRAHKIIGGSTEPYPGWHGYFVHKNAMSPYLVFALATLLVWEKRRVPRVLGFVVIMALMAGSQSGTGISASAFLISFYVWIVLYRRAENRWSGGFLIASAAVGLCLTVSAFVAVQQISVASGKGSSFSGRTFIWDAVFQAILERPLLGYGYGGLFMRPASDATREIWRNIGFDAPHPHNGFLDVLVQVGVIGMAVFGALFVSTLLGGISIRQADQRVADWILLVLCVQIVISLSEPVFLGPWIAVIVMLRGITLKSSSSWRESHGQLAMSRTLNSGPEDARGDEAGAFDASSHPSPGSETDTDSEMDTGTELDTGAEADSDSALAHS